jgi:pyridoxal phosphate-dependent aminotransferase EpsN
LFFQFSTDSFKAVFLRIIGGMVNNLSTHSNNKIFLSSPHMSGLEQEFVAEAFSTNWIAPLGPNVDAFEHEMAAYVGVAGACALSSGTAAIHLALKLLEIGPHDEVFCSSLTFIASANPIFYQGAVPVFIDSEPDSWNMSPAALKRALEDRAKSGRLPKAVVVVDLYGQSAQLDSLTELCDYYNVPIIEDAAEALGASYKGRLCGSLGEYGILSFNGNKIITTGGGGMLLSNNLEGLEKARFWATQARDPVRHYQHSEVGYNYRLSNVSAGIGRGQLKVLDNRIARRRAIFDRYCAELSTAAGFEFMPEIKEGVSTHWLTVLTVNQPDGITAEKIMDVLAEENIEARPVWKPLHLQPLFNNCEYYPHSENESVSDYIFKYGICLPSGSNLTDADQTRIITTIKNIAG